MKNKKIPKKKVSYYDRLKNDPAFKEHRNALARAYREAHPEVKEYQRKYSRKYYAANKERLNKERKNYPDPTRNERVNRFKKKERDNLGKNYIISLLTRSGKIKKEDITPYMIAKRRKQILQKRALRPEIDITRGD